jgi:hypothetical protein
VGEVFFVEGEGGEVADEDGVWLSVGDVAEEAFFGGFEDAEGGEGDLGLCTLLLGFADKSNRVFVAAGVFEVGVDQGWRRVEGEERFEL